MGTFKQPPVTETNEGVYAFYDKEEGVETVEGVVAIRAKLRSELVDKRRSLALRDYWPYVNMIVYEPTLY